MEYLTIVYKGEGSNTLYTAYFDGTSWHGNNKISDEPGKLDPKSNYNPGAAVFNNWIYLIYKGESSNDLYTCYFDGSQWNGNIRISEQNGGISPKSNYCPSLAVYKGLLFTVYKGESSDTLYSAWFDGTTWYGDTKISDQPGKISPESNYNPGMAVFNNKLYIVYKGASSNTLYLAWFDGATWAGNTKISDMPGKISPKSNYNPGAAVFNGKLYIVYKGESSNDLYTAWFDGTTWYGNTKISDQPGKISPKSNYCPNADVYGANLYIVYKGESSDDLYTAWFDGTTWYGNTKISDQPGKISPESSYNPGITIAASPPPNKATWMRDLPDTVSLGAINIPGTHDSAAINTSIHTPYACQNASISKQLDYGIRLLDVRIQVSQSGATFKLMTCHGSIGSSTGVNVYQSLQSLLDECSGFLHNNTSEVVLVSLKIDDWSDTIDRTGALNALKSLLATYPTVSQSTLPTLGAVRGKIFLYNRIDDSLSFGCPISWSDNTAGSYARTSANRTYQVYVQDKYKDLPTTGANQAKFDLVVASYQQKSASPVVWSFASATWYGVFGVYIQGDLLNYFGKDPATARLRNFGWTLFDYPFNSYNTDTYGALNIVMIVISSNFGYAGYENRFKVVNDGHDEL